MDGPDEDIQPEAASQTCRALVVAQRIIWNAGTVAALLLVLFLTSLCIHP
jgi:hypothetical protein